MDSIRIWFKENCRNEVLDWFKKLESLKRLRHFSHEFLQSMFENRLHDNVLNSWLYGKVSKFSVLAVVCQQNYVGMSQIGRFQSQIAPNLFGSVHTA